MKVLHRFELAVALDEAFDGDGGLGSGAVRGGGAVG
jgi:hypothetical protein